MGVDPGRSGAIAYYDTQTRKIIGEIVDIPFWYQIMSNKKKRKRVDVIGLADIFDMSALFGVDLIVLEEVGPRPKESPVASFSFGYGVGVIYTCAIYTGCPIDTVPPAAWKQMMAVRGKARADDTAIVQRADEMFPDRRRDFRGPRGGLRLDRAEACMIAKFGGDVILPTLQGRPSLEDRLCLRNVETGA